MTARSLQLISEGSRLTPEQAWQSGTNVMAAYNDPTTRAQVEAALIIILKRTLQYLDYNKTIRSDEDVLFAVRELREGFPAMKLEEWQIIFDRLKTGHYKPGYERLKLPELMTIFQAYEGERAEMRENLWREAKKHAPTTLSDEGLEALYANYNKQREEAQRERQKETEINRVKVDERGRWEHIPYQTPQSTDAERDGQEG